VQVRHAYSSDDKWIGVSSDAPLPLDRWSSATFIYTGDEICLLLNRRITGRRLLYSTQMSPIKSQNSASKYFYVGSWVDRKRDQYIGDIGGLQFWNVIPQKYDQMLLDVEKQGTGEVNSKYQSLTPHIRGILGQPKGKEFAYKGGRIQEYEGGGIFWSENTGAHVVYGSIYKVYKGAYRVKLGWPLRDEDRGLLMRSRVSRFENGVILWSSSVGAFPVLGPICSHYMKLGRERGIMKMPISFPLGNNTQLFQKFSGGRIYHNPKFGTFEVHGAILDRYLKLLDRLGVLGWPISNEYKIYSALGLEIGRASRFEKGIIYRSRATGTFEVYGLILKAYLEQGGPAGKLGLPMSGEKTVAGSTIGVRYNQFTKGMIIWKPDMKIGLPVTSLQLYIDRVDMARGIDDGLGDSSPELMSQRWVMGQGQKNKNSMGQNINFNLKHNVNKVTPSTKIHFKIKLYDHDRASKNDYLGIINKSYGLKDFWGMESDGAGIYQRIPMSGKGADSPSTGAFVFSYRISTPPEKILKNQFREKGWWRFHNPKTPKLTKSQYASTFTDVDYIDDWFEAALNGWDAAFYLVYQTIAETGNCFGMSVEGLRAYHDQSLFPNPINRFSKSKALPSVNIRHGYQLGNIAVNWIVGRMASLEAFLPIACYRSVKKEIDRRGPVIVSVYNYSEERGHSVLAYDYDSGKRRTEYARIYIADPSFEFREGQSRDDSFIAVYPNNTFKIFKGGNVSYSSDKTLMFHTPYNIVSKQPRSPYAQFLAYSALVAGTLMIFGDAETQTLSVDGKPYMEKINGKKTIYFADFPDFSLIPIAAANGASQPSLFAGKRVFPNKIDMELKGRRTGSYRKFIQTKNCMIDLKSPIARMAKDVISVDSLQSPRPLVSLKTTQNSKTSDLEYMIVADPKGRSGIKYKITLPQEKNIIKRVGVARRGGALEIETGGSQSPISIGLEIGSGENVKKSFIRNITPLASDKAIRIRPCYWDSPVGDVLLERLSAFNGGVLEKKIIRGYSR
jgi:hypothetical protein